MKNTDNKLKRIIKIVEETGEWIGKLNFNQISGIQAAGLCNMTKGNKYLVVKEPSKFNRF